MISAHQFPLAFQGCPTSLHTFNAAANHHHWHNDNGVLSPVATFSSPHRHRSMFLPDQNYPSPTSSLNSPLQTPHLQLDQYSSHTQQSSLPHPHMQDNRIFSQVESSIGPTRQTRRQASLLQGPLGERRLSVSRSYPASKRDNSPVRVITSFFISNHL